MLNYQGSKSTIGKWIKEFIPKDTQNYVEVFGGMMKLYFNMDLTLYPNLNNIVYNDFTSVNSNIFKCVQSDHNRLREIVESIPYPTKDYCRKGGKSNWLYETLYYQYQRDIFNKSYSNDHIDFNAGAYYAYVLSHSMNGTPDTKFIDPKNKYDSKYQSFINKLNKTWYHNHFDNITEVLNLDFSDCINKWDDANTLFYLDPPYNKKEHYYKNHNFNIYTHKRLSDQVKTIKGKWILSYYFFNELEVWFPIDRYKWFSKEFTRPSANHTGENGTEILIMNFEPENVPEGTCCISDDFNQLDIAA